MRPIAQEACSGSQRTASPDRSDLALELTFGNQKHLSSYAMDRLDVGRHPCASTWVRMVIIAPRELGQSSDGLTREKSAQGKIVCGDIRAETITKDTSDQLKRRKSRKKKVSVLNSKS